MKRRKDSFFGLHFDFHARPGECPTMGQSLREEDIREICRTIRPDFIQIDCKGHPGWCSYPTALGNAMPDFSTDTLALWRRVTREENVALYMHYSGIYDEKYCTEHPEEGAMLADGSYEPSRTYLGGHYVDELLIPQLSELAEKWGVDGVWIDGDCWSALPDFRPASLQAFEKDTGISLEGRLPATREDPYFHEYREYFRERYRQYLRHYVDTLHSRHPDFQIASNWAFTDHMPERVSANVDFLSGDLNPTNSVASARYAARAIVQQSMTWDLMSWNFRNKTAVGQVTKHPTQILQEAASVISLGGGFQPYIAQHLDGSPDMEAVRPLSVLSDFIRKREAWCHHGRPIHQAALLVSTYDRGRESKRLYSRNGWERAMGLTSLLCDVGQSLEIVFEDTLKETAEQYGMIVVPELFEGLERSTVDRLLRYASEGGSLLLVGRRTCTLFSENGAPFGAHPLAELVSEQKKETDNGHEEQAQDNTRISYRFTLDGTRIGALISPCAIEAPSIEATASLISPESATVCAVVPYGKGQIAAIGFDVGSQYLCAEQYLHRTLMRTVCDRLYTPTVKIGSVIGRLEIVLLEKDGRIMLQLINANGSHRDLQTLTDDVLPPVVDARLSISMQNKPRALILQPEGRPLDFDYRDGRVYFSVDRVDIHSVVEVIE